MSTRSEAAEAFSRKAALYDSFGQDHPNLERMRARVRAHIESLAPPGARLLELNAGTGGDAAFFAGRGYRVLATDIAPGMLAAAREKRTALGLEDRMEVRALSFTDLDSLAGERFDLVYSNMGGLNCIPDLAPVTEKMGGLLAPGGHVVFVLMPRICPWEWTALRKGDTRSAFRRLRPGGVIASVEGLPVATTYFTARTAEKAFGPGFRRIGLENLSLFTPPADHKAFAHRRPRLYRFLAALDDACARLPLLRGWGDFYLLTMQARR